MTWRDPEWYKSIDLQQHNPQFGDLVMYTACFTAINPSGPSKETNSLPLIPYSREDCTLVNSRKYCTLVRYNNIGIFGKFPRKRRWEAVKQTLESDYLSPGTYSFTLDSIIFIGGSPVPHIKFTPAEEYSGKGSQKLFLVEPYGYIGDNYKWIVGKRNILDYLSIPPLDIFVPFIDRMKVT